MLDRTTAHHPRSSQIKQIRKTATLAVLLMIHDDLLSSRGTYFRDKSLNRREFRNMLPVQEEGEGKLSRIPPNRLAKEPLGVPERLIPENL